MLQFLPLLGSLLDKIIPDKDAQEKAKHELAVLTQSQEGQSLLNQFNVITAEAKSDHWIVASWRPCLMMVFIFIIANNYIIAPYVSLLFSVDLELEMPPEMWDLLKLGVSGYIVGRSGEKVIKEWKK